LFVDVPKAAGTTFKKVLANQYTGGCANQAGQTLVALQRSRKHYDLIRGHFRARAP
jgi:hypothetical protein